MLLKALANLSLTRNRHDEDIPPSADQPGPVLRPTGSRLKGPKLERAAPPEADAVAQGLALAKVYAFASVDYPGAALSRIWETARNGTTAVGMFDFDAYGSATGGTAFTFTSGIYEILMVPGSTTSVAWGHQ